MDSSELSARLRYLNDSSHLLATCAPVTSRYLMSRHNTLLIDHDIERSDSQRRKACGACGTLLVIGWEATIEMRRQKKPKGKEPSTCSRAMVYRCGTCNQTTQFHVDPTPKCANRPGPISKAIARDPMHSQPVSSIPPSNQKKRSRAAKHGGLKALLQKKKENTTTSSGFDLMDFMKTTGT